jgi:hypothetical protein
MLYAFCGLFSATIAGIIVFLAVSLANYKPEIVIGG